MLYVILTPQMNEKREFCYAIKFGYSSDFENKRKIQYQSYFWNFEILHYYEQGNEDLEKRIKYHLKDYLLFGKEWFKYCPEVIEFFEKYNTYEKLKEFGDQVIMPDTEAKDKRFSKNKVNMQLIQYVYEKVFIKENLDVRIDLERKLIQELKRYKSREQVMYVIEKYSLDEKDLTEYIKTKSTNLSKSSELANEFNSNNNVVEKLKFLVKTGEDEKISKEEFYSFLNNIPARFKNYYLEMGPDRIRANSFQESKLKEEWIKQKHGEVEISEDLANVIFGYFKLGHKYSRSGIKETLKEMYQKYGYQKTAKASDLQEYFWTKDVKFLEDGKWVNGFELLDKK